HIFNPILQYVSRSDRGMHLENQTAARLDEEIRR
ncbi:MAG: hypothetical protein K0R31_1010, partial [Clostridiales bacterium]|nr:hypothetical protein [Clostridiales bacterium]